MGKVYGLTTLLIVVLALAAAWSFGFVAPEQFAYLGNMIVGWTAWTCFVAVLYAGLEKLFPNLLCSPHQDS